MGNNRTNDENTPRESVKPKKLNLGCGTDIREGFVNLDIQKFDKVDYSQSATDLSNFETNSIDFIVAQHLLEYIPRSLLVPALIEWKRVLKKNEGILEIRVTDLESLTKGMYLHTISPEMGIPSEMIISLLYGRQFNLHDIRFNGFTSSYLEGICRGLNFECISIVREEMDVICTFRNI